MYKERTETSEVQVVPGRGDGDGGGGTGGRDLADSGAGSEGGLATHHCNEGGGQEGKGEEEGRHVGQQRWGMGEEERVGMELDREWTGWLM